MYYPFKEFVNYYKEVIDYFGVLHFPTTFTKHHYFYHTFPIHHSFTNSLSKVCINKSKNLLKHKLYKPQESKNIEDTLYPWSEKEIKGRIGYDMKMGEIV